MFFFFIFIGVPGKHFMHIKKNIFTNLKMTGTITHISAT